MFYIFSGVSLLLFLIMLAIYLSYKRSFYISILGKFIRNSYLKSRFKIWDDLEHAKGGVRGVRSFRILLSEIEFKIHKAESTLFYYLALIFKSPQDSFILLNCDREADKCNDEDFPKHLTKQRQAVTFSIMVLFLLIIANISTGLIASFIFPNIFRLKAANQVVHNSLADWQEGAADSDIDYSSGALKLKLATSTTMDTLADFSRGVASTSEITLNPGYIQPKQTANVLWPDNGTIISSSTDSDMVLDFSAVSDGNGGAYMTWRKYYLDGDTWTNYYYIYSSTINSNGATTTPVLVSANTDDTKNNLTTIADGAGGVYMIWEDNRNRGEEQNYDIYMQHRDSSGNLLDNDFDLVDALGDQQNPVIATTSNYLITFYRDNRYNFRIGATLLNLNDYTKTDLDIVNEASSTNSLVFRAIPTSDDGVIIVWSYKQVDESSNATSSIYTQKINSNGTLAWQENGKPLFAPLKAGLNNNFSNYDGLFDLAPDNNGGAYLSYLKSEVTDQQGAGLYLTRINSAGDMLAEWGTGILVRGSYALSAQLVPDGSNNIAVVWSDSQIFIYDAAIKAQEFDSSGNKLWAEDKILGEQFGFLLNFGAPLSLIKDDNLYVVWSALPIKENFNGSDTLEVQKVNSSGSILFDKYAEKISDFSFDGIKSETASDLIKTSDGFIIFYQRDNKQYFAQKIGYEVRYNENSTYTSPVIDLDNSNWTNIDLSGLSQNATVETRTSNNLSFGATPQASSNFSGLINYNGNTYHSAIVTSPDQAVDGFNSIDSMLDISAWWSQVHGSACSVSTSSQWYELDYPATTTIGYIKAIAWRGLTVPIPGVTFSVGSAPAAYEITTWNGSRWVSQTAATTSATTITYTFPTPVSTTKIRINSLYEGMLGFSGYNEVETYADSSEVWSDWEPLSEEGMVVSPKKRYLQYRVIMNIASTTPADQIPTIDSVTVSAIPDWVTNETSPIYTSTIIDAGYGNYGTDWETIELDKDTPNGTSVAVAVRSGQTATPDGNWSDWATTTSENISVPAGRYFQYRVALTSNDREVTPTVNSISVNYNPLAGPGTPNENISSSSLPGSTSCSADNGYEDFINGSADGNLLLNIGDGITFKPIIGDWTDGGLAVASNSANQLGEFLAEGNSQNRFLTAWQDQRNDDGDIYIQGYSNDGDAQCGDGGVGITDGRTNTQSDVTAVINSNNTNLYLVWKDQRDGVQGIYAQNSDEYCNVSWDAGGIPISTYDSEKQNIEAQFLGGYNATLVSWEDNRNGVYDIYENGFGDDGSLFSPSDIAIATSTSNKINHKFLYNESDGTFILVWQDDRNSNQDIYAEKFAADGSVYPGWSATGTPICVTGGDQTKPQLFSDGSGGAIIVWEDERNPVNGKDIYMQYINSDGEIQWALNGQAVVSTTGDQDNFIVPTAGAIIWEDSRSGNIDIYGQFYQAGGTPVFQENGSPIVTASGDQTDPQAVVINSEVYVAWKDQRNDSGDIYTQKLDATGVLWQENGVPVALETGEQSQPKIINDVNNSQAIVSWIDGRGAYTNIYMQKLLTDPTSATSGTYTSAYFDAGSSVNWVSLYSTSTKPTGTDISFEARVTDGDPAAVVTNLSIGATANSSSNYNPGFELAAGLAIDGSTDFNPPGSYSSWVNDLSLGLPAWLEVDLPEPANISSVVIKSLSTGGLEAYPYNYLIQTGDGGDWVTQATTTGNTSLNKTETFSAVSTDKVRIYITAANPALAGTDYASLIGITEFEIYASTGSGWSDWETVSDNLISSSGGRYLQYRANFSSLSAGLSPTLSNVGVCYSTRSSHEMFEYTPVDSDSASTTWLSLYASTTIPTGTSIEWATRSGNTATPDGTWDDWATTTYAISSQHGRYLQYRAYLSTTNPLVTPEIYAVTVRYLTSDGEEEHEDNPPEEYLPISGASVSTVHPVIPPLEGNFSCKIASPADFSDSIPKVTSRTVNLKLNGGPSALMMAVSESPNLLEGTFDYYQTNYQLTLSPNNGVKTIYVKFFNEYGASSNVAICQVELAAPAPATTEKVTKTEDKTTDNNKKEEDKTDKETKTEKKTTENKTENKTTETTNQDATSQTSNEQSSSETASTGSQSGGSSSGSTVVANTGSGNVVSAACSLVLNNTLELGQTDRDVRILKGMLKNLGYLASDFDISNEIFGEQTSQAVILFQQDNQLAASGMIDAQTRDALNKAWQTSINCPKEKEAATTTKETTTTVASNTSSTTKPIEKIVVTVNEARRAVASSTAATAGTTALAATYVALTVLQFASQANSASQIPSIFFNLLGFVAYRRKKRAGLVYDAVTGAPVPFAKIIIYDKATGQAKETKMTDKYGSYFFLVPKGEYTIKATKKGYDQLYEQDIAKAKTTYASPYTKGKVLKFEQEDIVNVNIPIQQVAEVPLLKLFNKPAVSNFLNIIFILGIIASIIMAFASPTAINITIISIYLILAVLKYVNLAVPQWGVVSTMTGQTQPFTVVEALEAETKKMFGRTVSDEHGRYAFILDKGDFDIEAKTTAGDNKTEKIKVKKRKLVGKNISLQ